MLCVRRSEEETKPYAYSAPGSNDTMIDVGGDENEGENISSTYRAVLIGDQNVGKYDFYDALNEEYSGEFGGNINISLGDEFVLHVTHVEGLEMEPLIRKRRYKNANVFVLFFSLTKPNTYVNAAYKWGQEILTTMECNHQEGKRKKFCILGLVGLYDERSSPIDVERVTEDQIQSLCDMLKADFYLKIHKTYDTTEVQKFISTVYEKIRDYESTEDENEKISSISRCSRDFDPDVSVYGTLNDSTPSDASLLLDASEIQGHEENNENSLPSMKSIFRIPGVKSLTNEGKQNDTVDNFQLWNEEFRPRLDEIKSLTASLDANFRRNSKKKIPLSRLESLNESELSEQSSLYRQFFDDEINADNSGSIKCHHFWDKKHFKQYIYSEMPTEEEPLVLLHLKEGFEILRSISGCFDRNKFQKELQLLQKRILECLEFIRQKSFLSFIQMEDFYLLCKFSFIQVLLHILHRYPKGFAHLIRADPYIEKLRKTPPLCEIEDEKLVLLIMRIYHPKLYSSTKLDARGCNLLHYFVEKNFPKAVDLYFKQNREDAIEMCLTLEDTNSPIADAAQSQKEEMARKLYRHLTSQISQVDLHAFSVHEEFKSVTLLRICARQKLNGLFGDIIATLKTNGMEDVIASLLVDQGVHDGKALIMDIQDEHTLNNLLFYYLSTPDALFRQCIKKNHIGHYLAGRNFDKSLQMIHSYCVNSGIIDQFFSNFLLCPNKYGDDCCKIAAWKGSNEFLVCALSLCRGIAESSIHALLHATNKLNENLLEMVLYQQGSLIVPRQMIILIEKEYHKSSWTEILSCFREFISPSDVLTACIQDTRKLLPMSKTNVCGVWLNKLIALLFSLGLFLMDAGFDISLAVKYSQTPDNECLVDYYDYPVSTNETHYERTTRYTNALCASTRFGITLFFIVSPWIFYLCEVFIETFIRGRAFSIIYFPNKITKLTSYRSGTEYKKLKALIKEQEDPRFKPAKHFWTTNPRMVLRNVTYWFLFVVELCFTVAFWPFISLWRLFISEGRYEVHRGLKKTKAREKKNAASYLWARARLIEGLVEASFQPILQLYLVLPALINTPYFNINFWQNVNHDTSLKLIQFLSAVSSVITLSWAITTYQASIKGGAMDLTVNFSGRFVLLLSNVCIITARLIGFVLVAYSSGPGILRILIILVIIHMIFMSSLHYYWRDPNIPIHSKFSYAVNCVLNGFGNIYLHLWIELPENIVRVAKSGKSTFVRQAIFHLTFLLELLIIMTYVGITLEDSVARAIQLYTLLPTIFICHIFGICINILYYEQFHMWSDLISIRRECSRFFK